MPAAPRLPWLNQRSRRLSRAKARSAATPADHGLSRAKARSAATRVETNQPAPTQGPDPRSRTPHEVSTDASRSAPAMAQPAVPSVEPRQGAKRRNARRPWVEPRQGAQRRNARRPWVEPRQGAQRRNARRNQPTPTSTPDHNRTHRRAPRTGPLRTSRGFDRCRPLRARHGSTSRPPVEPRPPPVEPRQGAKRRNARRNQRAPAQAPDPGPRTPHEVSTDAGRSAPAMAQPADLTRFRPMSTAPRPTWLNQHAPGNA